jgi:hypothetical protein
MGDRINTATAPDAGQSMVTPAPICGRDQVSQGKNKFGDDDIALGTIARRPIDQ